MEMDNEKMASQNKEINRRDSKQISFRVSENDYARLQESAETLGMSVTKFAKMKAQGARVIKPVVDKETGLYILTELNRIGNNINQIAYWCNAGGKDYMLDEHNTDKFLAKLNEIESELAKVWQQLS